MTQSATLGKYERAADALASASHANSLQATAEAGSVDGRVLYDEGIGSRQWSEWSSSARVAQAELHRTHEDAVLN